MISKTLLAAAILLFIFVVTTVANAEEVVTYERQDVVCATLAYNAGYDEKGQEYADRVDPYYVENKQAIMAISHETISNLAEEAMEWEKTLPYVARKRFESYCKDGDDD